MDEKWLIERLERLKYLMENITHKIKKETGVNVSSVLMEIINESNGKTWEASFKLSAYIMQRTRVNFLGKLQYIGNACMYDLHDELKELIDIQEKEIYEMDANELKKILEERDRKIEQEKLEKKKKFKRSLMIGAVVFAGWIVIQTIIVATTGM